MKFHNMVIVSASLYLLSSHGFGTDVQIEPIGDWQKEQLKLIERATKLVVERMPSYEVAMCSFRNSTRGKPSKDQWAKISA